VVAAQWKGVLLEVEVIAIGPFIALTLYPTSGSIESGAEPFIFVAKIGG